MDVVHWTIADVDRRSRSLIAEELQGAAILILDDATADGDHRLTWCRTAPCPVVAITAGPNVDPNGSTATPSRSAAATGKCV